jgi:hypothetical protein
MQHDLSGIRVQFWPDFKHSKEYKQLLATHARHLTQASVLSVACFIKKDASLSKMLL